MLMTTTEILNDIEELFNCDVEEQVIQLLKDNEADLTDGTTTRFINFMNEELKRLHMPYTIKINIRLKSFTDQSQQTWSVEHNLFPSKLNWNEIVKLDERGEAVYQTLLEPFKDANVFFPITLKSAKELFKVNFNDDWKLRFYRDWLISINTAMYPHECKAIMQKLMALTVKV